MNPKRRKTRRNDGPFHHEVKKVVRFNARNQEL
jgi:hypothetical protein